MPRLDRAFKALAERDADALVRLVCGIPWDRPLNIRPVDREVIIPSQPVDQAYLVLTDDRRVVHFEAFAYADHAAEDQQISHATRVGLKYRRPVQSYMVLLSPRYPGNRLTGPAEVNLGDLHWRLSYRRVRMWELDPAVVLAVDRPHLLPWVAAMNSTGADLTEAARRIRLLPNAKLARRLLSDFVVLAAIRYTQSEIEGFSGEIGMLMTEEIVKASWLVQDYAEKVRQKAEAAGEKRGVALGRMENIRDSIRVTLKTRFPKAAPVPELDRIASRARLDALFRLALTAKSATEFRKALVNGNGH